MNAIATARAAGRAVRNRILNPVCPTNPAHGALLSWSGTPAGFDWHCSHHQHDRDGTRCFFSDDEAQSGQVAS